MNKNEITDKNRKKKDHQAELATKLSSWTSQSTSLKY
jgi:hypothetical protein